MDNEGESERLGEVWIMRVNVKGCGGMDNEGEWGVGEGMDNEGESGGLGEGWIMRVKVKGWGRYG